MQRKLSKNAILLIVLCLILAGGIIIRLTFFGTSNISQTKKQTIVLQDTILKVQLLDFISEETASDSYIEKAVDISQGEKIAGYKISNDQSFLKLLQLLPPDENTPLLNNNTTKATHYAYTLVLIGDIASSLDENDNEVYQIVNARITYYRQPLVVISQYDSVYIMSADYQKEKLVRISEYKSAISDINNYQQMIQW